MSFTDQDVYSFYTGNGSTDEFAIGFEIQDNNQVDVYLYDTTTKLETLQTAGVHYDFENTVTPLVPNPANQIDFVTPPPVGKQVRIYRNTDLTQETELENNGTPQTSTIESALDKIVMMVQEVAARANRALVRDILDSDLNMNIPLKLGKAGQFIVLNEDEDGWEWSTVVAGDLTAAIDAAAASALAAAASASAASASALAAAASAAAAAASAADMVETSFAVTDGQSATDLTGETLDSAIYSACIYTFVIFRGTTVFSSGMFSIHWRNGAWELVYPWSDNRADAAADHGVTFSISGTTTAQLRAALNSGAGDGKIKLKKSRFLV